MSEDNAGPEGAGPEEEMFAISYKAVVVGQPVVTNSGDQFGVVEHVLEVPELDVFDGIVVYTGTGLSAAHPKDEVKARAEMLRVGAARGWLRFVDADQIATITTAYVKCTFDQSHVAQLPVPDGPPVFYPDMAREDRAASHAMFGQWFRRPGFTGHARWIPKKN
jgi:hypothetical protein